MSNRIKWRALFIGAVLTLFFFALMFRVYWVQAVEAEELLVKAKAMWEQSKVLTPSRGVIYDRNGNVLAQDAPSYTVAVNPRLIHEEGVKYDVIDLLAEPLGLDHHEGRRKLEDLLSRTNANGQLPVQREIRNEGWKIDHDVAEKIRERLEEKQLPGVYLLEEPKRYYPSNELAAHILGYQDKEGNAVMGLEKLYDEELSGEPGYVHYESDLFGNITPDSKIVYEPARDGHSLRLTIDANIQLYIEQALEEVYRKYRPYSATAIAVDPQTMEVLGLANMPTFNPNRYWVFNDYRDFYNHAVSSQYEPGSTFKIVTLAAAVEEGLFDPDETYMSGRIPVPGIPDGIKDHNYGQGWGEITFLEGLKRSSNVAFVKLGYERLGGERLRHYINQFGFGKLTGIDIPGETPGIVNFWRPAEVATASFGQGIAVTAIQQIAAVSAVANGGYLMKPYIVKEIIDSETGKVIRSNEPTKIRQVISEETARQVGQYLETVISDQEMGTGRLAYIPEYRMAGKTGTAQKVENGKYASDKWVLSFVGYAPLENPRIALLVIIDEPDMGGDYRNGGPIIAPVFKEIMSKSLRYLGVASDGPASGMEPELSTVQVPDVEGLTLAAAENEMDKKGLRYEALGSANRIVRQYPEAGELTLPGQTVYLLTEEPDKIAFPDLKGKPLIDALQICALLEAECETHGKGYVVSQQVQSGSVKKVRLELEPLTEPESEETDSEAEHEDDRDEADQIEDGRTEDDRSLYEPSDEETQAAT